MMSIWTLGSVWMSMMSHSKGPEVHLAKEEQVSRQQNCCRHIRQKEEDVCLQKNQTLHFKHDAFQAINLTYMIHWFNIVFFDVPNKASFKYAVCFVSHEPCRLTSLLSPRAPQSTQEGRLSSDSDQKGPYQKVRFFSTGTQAQCGSHGIGIDSNSRICCDAVCWFAFHQSQRLVQESVMDSPSCKQQGMIDCHCGILRRKWIKSSWHAGSQQWTHRTSPTPVLMDAQASAEIWAAPPRSILHEPWSILTIWLMVIPSIIRILIMVIINPYEPLDD